MPSYYDTIAQYYAEIDGPYLLGDKITYADFAVYQSIDNDQRTGTLPVSIHMSPDLATALSLTSSPTGEPLYFYHKVQRDFRTAPEHCTIHQREPAKALISSYQLLAGSK